VKPAPRDFIETFIGGSDYWANGIRKEYRTTNPDQIAFCDTFKNVIVELAKYVKEFHTTGLAWNKNGGDISSFNADAAAAPKTEQPAAAAAAAKPAAAPAKSAAAPTANLFAELNKEGAITSGLKKVTKDMQTWRAEYKGGDAPAPAATKAPAAKPVPARDQVKGPPKLEFQEGGAKWVVENQSATPEPIAIEIKEKRETVYIFGCIGATISIKGKCKSIVVDSCKKTTVYFEVAMASVEVVNSQRMNIHCLQTVSSVAIDKTDGIIVHLPATSLTTEVVASKSSEMNLSFPDETGEIIERPIPEQYVHRIKGTTVTAAVSDLYSH
jgi:adenylyl cyclase-associated protein